METQGRTSADYHDYFAEDPQPRIWGGTDVTDPANPVPTYHGMAPCGHRFHFNPKHLVEPEEDGTFTVQPNPPADPGNSNSILCRACGWHGYVDHNVWRTV